MPFWKKMFTKFYRCNNYYCYKWLYHQPTFGQDGWILAKLFFARPIPSYLHQRSLVGLPTRVANQNTGFSLSCLLADSTIKIATNMLYWLSARLRWLDIILLTLPSSCSIKMQKEWGQYSAILNEQTWAGLFKAWLR